MKALASRLALCAGAVLVLTHDADAQTGDSTGGAQPATPPPSPGIAAGVRLDLLPAGTLAFEAEGMEDDADTDTAFAVAGTVDMMVSPRVSVGIAPRIIFGVAPEDETESATEIDLVVRAAAHMPLSPNARAYGFIAPGYSILLLPEEIDELSPKGFVFGFGAGVTVDVTPTAFLGGELGYQLGFQGGEEMGIDYTLSTNYLHIGASAGVKL